MLVATLQKKAEADIVVGANDNSDERIQTMNLQKTQRMTPKMIQMRRLEKNQTRNHN